MTDNIFTFKARPVLGGYAEEKMWLCACGSQWFWLLEGGEIQCTQCDEVQEFAWFNPAEQKP